MESHGSRLRLHLSGWQINLTVDVRWMRLGESRRRKTCEGSGEIGQVTERRGQCQGSESRWKGEERFENQVRGGTGWVSAVWMGLGGGRGRSHTIWSIYISNWGRLKPSARKHNRTCDFVEASTPTLSSFSYQSTRHCFNPPQSWAWEVTEFTQCLYQQPTELLVLGE